MNTQDSQAEEITDSDGGGENWRRKMERERSEAVQRAEAAESRLAALERAEAFRSAGVDPTSKMGSYFLKGYDGELTVEAIQAEAREAGLLSNAEDQPMAAQQPMVITAPEYQQDVVQNAAIDAAMQGGAAPAPDGNVEMMRLQQAVASGQMSPQQGQQQLEALLLAQGYTINAME